MYPQGVCRIRKPAYAGNDCAIFPVFDTEEGDLIRVSFFTQQSMKAPSANEVFIDC